MTIATTIVKLVAAITEIRRNSTRHISLHKKHKKLVCEIKDKLSTLKICIV